MINQSDRIFIAKMVSVQEAGIYNLGYQFGSLLLVAVSAFSNMFTPYLYERLANPTLEAKRQIVRMSYLFLGGILVLLLGLTAFGPWFFGNIVDARYLGSQKYVFWVGLSYFFWGVYIVVSGFIFFKNQNRILGYLGVFNMIFNIVLNYVLIGKFGALGAAYATCISFFTVSVAVAGWVGREFELPWFEFQFKNR